MSDTCYIIINQINYGTCSALIAKFDFEVMDITRSVAMLSDDDQTTVQPNLATKYTNM